MKKILFINPFGIGDAIFTLRLAESVRVADPLCKVGFVGNERTEALLNLVPAIDKVFVFNRDYYRRLWRESPLDCLRKLQALLGEIRAEKFDVAVDVSLGREYALGALLAGIHRRVGFDYKNRGIFLNRKIKLTSYDEGSVTDKQMELLPKTKLPHGSAQVKISFRISSKAVQEAETFLSAFGIQPQDRVIAIAPGGGKSWGENAIYKQWDPERFAQAANRWAADRDAKVLLLGDESEEGLLGKVAADLRMPAAVACGFPIENVCALLKRSEGLLCNDGGLMHLANALGVKLVAIFGPVDEHVYGPYGGAPNSLVVTQTVPCRPCYQKFHFPPCPHARRCLDELSVETVFESIKKIT